MLSVFLYAFNAVSPILILCLAGYFLKIRGIFDVDFFKKLNKLAFHYCFPALMFVNVYSLDSIRKINVRLGIYIICSIIVLTLVGLVLANLLTKQRNRKGVITQAGFRSNFAVIGLPLAEGLAGSDGLAVTSSMQAPVVIYYNFFAVLFFAIFSDDAQFDLKKVAHSIVSNPMIQGLTAGVVALVVREFIPVNADGSLVFTIKGSLPWFYTVLTYISRCATPMALVYLGGQFSFSQVAGFKKELIASVSMRLILAPVLGFSMVFLAVRCGFLTLSPAVMATLIAVYGSPLSVSTVPMAAEMHADAALAGQVVVWTSFLSMFTIFTMVVICRFIGLL